MVIFNSYASLPEGTSYNIILGSLGLGHQGRCGVLQLPHGHLGAMERVEQGDPSGDVLLFAMEDGNTWKSPCFPFGKLT